uniref:Ribonuclease A-domain domain-containing protein n=1 Tax=Seriola dumerili TaxID=41447 RepID=A0A3B4TGJ1_SERDU
MNVRCLFACLLLVLLSAAQYTEGATHEDFKRQHIDEGKNMKEGDCQKVIDNKTIRDINNKYKPINTFILEMDEKVIKVCTDGSKDMFNLIVCELGADSKYTGTKKTARIRISCRDGLPVHFSTDI